MKTFEVKIMQDVAVYSMDEQVVTTLLFNGDLYDLRREMKKESEEKTSDEPEMEDDEEEPEKKPVSDKTEELRRLVMDEKIEKKQVGNVELRGDVVARCGSTLIRRKPLNELLELKKNNKMTTLNMAGVLRKYYPDLKKNSIAVYRSGYANYINKSKNVEIRSNFQPLTHETVKESDLLKVYRIVYESCVRGKHLDFDGVLREVDWTEYKLKLVVQRLIEGGRIETFYVDGKLLHRVTEEAVENRV